MGNFLQGLSEFGTGASRGFGQGLDMYQQVKQVQEEGQLRQRRQNAESEIGKLVESGLPKSDPTKFTEEAANIFLKNSDFENYDKWSSQALSLKNMKADQIAHNMFAVSGTDPIAAVGLLNEWSGLKGTGMKFEAQSLPGGGVRFATSSPGGKPSAKEFQTPEEARMAIMDVVDRFSMKPEDYGKLAVDRGTASAQAAKWASDVRNDTSRTQAQNEASIASAGASRAAAGLSGVRATVEQAKAPSEIALAGSKAKQAEAEAANVGKADAPYDPMLEISDKLTEKSESLEYSPANDPAFTYAMGNAVRGATGLPPGEAFALGQNLSRMSPEALTTLDFDQPVLNINGTQMKNTPELMDVLLQLYNAAGVEAE